MGEPGVRRVEHVMGIPVGIDVRDEGVGENALDAAFEVLRRVDAMFSTYRPASEISRLGAGTLSLDEASPAMRLAATSCAFSEWLATSPFAAEVSTDELLKYISGVPQFYGADTRPAKLEWMIRQAKSISGK